MSRPGVVLRLAMELRHMDDPAKPSARAAWDAITPAYQATYMPDARRILRVIRAHDRGEEIDAPDSEGP